jgi:hypothetical protein
VAQTTGKIASPDLTELSSLSASRQFPDALWAHNDAGNEADLFLLGHNGATKGQWRLTDSGDKASRDWEASAVGPCRATDPAGARACVWIGDIGDNTTSRNVVRLFRWLEPSVLPAAGTIAKVGNKGLGAWEVVRVRYPEGPQDAEAMVILPDGRLVIATKREDGKTVLYRVDAAPALDAKTLEVSAELLATWNLLTDTVQAGAESRLTGADLSADGELLFLRSRDYVWRLQGAGLLAGTAASIAGAVPGWERLALPPPGDKQGEAVAVDAAGAVWTSSEGKSEPLHKLVCTP